MYVPESVAAAFGVLLLAKGDPMKAVLYGANIGGDTDTVASIAGAVCGAWKGRDTLDLQMVSRVEKVNDLDLGSEADRLVKIAEKKQNEH
jgi:ADP-ribosylglycohydrolase